MIIEARCHPCGWTGSPDDLRVNFGARLVCPACGKDHIRVEFNPAPAAERKAA